MLKLYAIYIGGKVPKAHIELHDLVFAIGKNINDCIPSIKAQRFGSPKSLHIDAYVSLQYIDGYEIVLQKEPNNNEHKLFCINTWFYDPDVLWEGHELSFRVEKQAGFAKQKALAKLSPEKQKKHKDDLLDVDDCLQITEVDWYHLHFIPTSKTQSLSPEEFGYMPITKQ